MKKALMALIVIVATAQMRGNCDVARTALSNFWTPAVQQCDKGCPDQDYTCTGPCVQQIRNSSTYKQLWDAMNHC